MLKSNCIKVTTTIKWLPVDSSLLRMISNTLTAFLHDPDIQILSSSRDSVDVDIADQNCYWLMPKIICISNFPSMSRAYLHHQRQIIYTILEAEIVDKYWQIRERLIVSLVTIDRFFSAVIRALNCNLRLLMDPYCVNMSKTSLLLKIL